MRKKMHPGISLTEIGIPIIFYSWLSVIVAGFWDLLYAFYGVMVVLLFAIIYNLYARKDKQINIRVLDTAVAFIVLAEVLNLFFSEYPANTFLFLTRLFVVVASYAIHTVINGTQWNYRLKLLIAAFGAVLGFATFFFFLVYRSTVLEEGFSDLLSLKHMYAPFGQLSNDWNTVLLIFLAFNLYLFLHPVKESKYGRWWAGTGVIFLMFSIMVSFSRGIYVAVAVFIALSLLLLIWSRSFNLRKMVTAITFILLTVLSMALLIRKPVLDTMIGNRTVSQERSISGRISMWRNAVAMTADHPISGIGSGNFALLYAGYMDRSADAAYTTRVNNTFLQVAIEKGALGVIAYGFLFMHVLYVLFRQYRVYGSDTEQSYFAGIMLSLMIALGIKEFTFSSFFEHGGLMLLVFLIIGLNRYGSRCLYSISVPPVKQFAVMIPLLVFIAVPSGYLLFSFQKGRSFHGAAVEAIFQNEYDDAVSFLNEAIKSNPNQALYRIHKAVALEKMPMKNFSPVHAESDGDSFDLIPKLSAERKIEIIDEYNEAIKLSPHDARAYHNLGWYMLATGENEKALYHFKTATEAEPSEAIYWISYGLAHDYLDYWPSADSMYVQAITLSPDIVNSIFWNDFSKRHPERAESLQQRAKIALHQQMDNNAIIRAKYASLLMSDPSETDNAIAMLEDVNREIPNLNRAWLNLGVLYFDAEKYQDAIVCVKRSVLFDKNDWKPLMLLASYSEKIKRYDQAIVYYYRALEMQINSLSQYDYRIGKMYEVPSSFQTLIPARLWFSLKSEKPMGYICSRLYSLYRKTGNKTMSNNFRSLRHKEILLQKDLQFKN